MIKEKKHIVFDCDGTLIDTNQLHYSLYPGIKDLLLSLSADSILYVWTARDRRSTLRIFEELGINTFFEQICTIDDALPKPHIAGLRDMLGETKKSHICIIGDTSNDIRGAKNFGVKSIGALWNQQAHGTAMEEMGANFLAQAPRDCLNWIMDNF